MKLLILIIALTTLSSFADDKKEAIKKKFFEEFKQEKVQHMDDRIELMQETRDCVAKATDYETNKKCRETLKTKMKAIRVESRKRHEAIMVKRKAALIKSTEEEEKKKKKE